MEMICHRLEPKSYVYRPFGYERVYLPFHKLADTPFHIEGEWEGVGYVTRYDMLQGLHFSKTK